MSLQLYNTLSRTLETFKPMRDGKVTFYSCGPTVYDYPHIGNWYTFMRWDILYRVLVADGYNTTWVMNITDVGHLVSDADEGEDKLEKGARREGKSAWDVAEYYTDYFIHAMERCNIKPPTLLVKATDHIAEQIALIRRLEEKGYTYKTTDGIYFDSSKFKDYGKLAKLDIAHLQEGARVETNPEKRHPTDFALWKFSPVDKKRDMEWDSPWGKGFPGWHIECSAMSMRYLGETIDIHAGGIDHIPVHHTNEIAQSEAASGKPLARYWVHSNFILIDGKKMSKSANNFYTLEDIEKRGYTTEHFRILVLESHYQKEANFSWELLEAAKKRYRNLCQLGEALHQSIIDKQASAITEVTLKQWQNSITEALDNNLNTPEALALLSTISSTIAVERLPKSLLSSYRRFVNFIDEALGTKLAAIADLPSEQKTLINQFVLAKQQAKDSNDYSQSDTLRARLQETGVTIRETSRGIIWQRTDY